MTIEKQLQDTVLNNIRSSILNYKGNENDWILWNGTTIHIASTLWEDGKILYTNFKVIGTVSEAKYHINQNSLLEFLLSEY